MRELNCLRCGCLMNMMGREKFQLGQYGFFLGHWSNLMAGAMEVEIYTCPQCGKIEFFVPEENLSDFEMLDEELPPEVNQNIVGVGPNGVPQVRCPRCGKTHDFDYPKCIFCDFEY